jgi:hypothetical protein
LRALSLVGAASEAGRIVGARFPVDDDKDEPWRPPPSRAQKESERPLNEVQDSEERVLLATGFDDARLDTLERDVMIYDYVDAREPILLSESLKRRGLSKSHPAYSAEFSNRWWEFDVGGFTSAFGNGLAGHLILADRRVPGNSAPQPHRRRVRRIARSCAQLYHRSNATRELLRIRATRERAVAIPR